MTPRQQFMSHMTTKPKKDRRHRFQFRFHLDVMHDDQLLLGEELDSLKRSRKYTSTILDALRLILDLRRGNIEVLRALFPGIVDKIERAAVERIESPANIEFAQLIERQTAILERLATQPVPMQALPSGQGGGAGPKPLNIPKFAPPTYDDDDMDTIQIKKDTSTNSSQNFLNSLSALAGNAFVKAAPEDPGTARKNFASGMGNLFGDEDEDF